MEGLRLDSCPSPSPSGQCLSQVIARRRRRIDLSSMFSGDLPLGALDDHLVVFPLAWDLDTTGVTAVPQVLSGSPRS